MGDTKGEPTTTTTKKPQSQTNQTQTQTQTQTQQQQQVSSSNSPKDSLEVVISTNTTTTSTTTPLFLPTSTSSSPFDQVVQFDQTATNNPKRTRYTTTTGQWKLLPSPKASSQHKNIIIPPPAQITILPSTDQPQQQLSSSDTASSPSQSLPSLSASGQDKPESDSNPVHHQFRKGKYVSPVWKPSEMLWLARAWRVQYQSGSRTVHADGTDGGTGKGKTRADKDREVAEFLNRQGVSRDAKTAGTKWDNMLGEFRKVYEWERGGERDQVGKSYFRLSPYERKLHRLPASFDEEVFEELSQFMGSRLRSSSSSSPQSARSGGGFVSANVTVDDNTMINRSASRVLAKDDDQFSLSARSKQLVVIGSGGGVGEPYYGYSGGRQSGTSMGYDQQADINILGPPPPSSSNNKELRRIGKVRMTWEESVSLWAEEGESHRGRVRLHGGSLSFLNADELTYFDDGMVASIMEGFEEGPMKGFSVDRFVPGQQVKVFGRKKSSFSSSSAFPAEKVTQLQQLPFAEPSIRSISPWEFQDPSEYYIGCLRVPPQSLPSLYELSWYLQESPPEELRFPLRKDVYRDLPQGKDLFFTITTEFLDCRTVTYDIVTPILRQNPSLTAATATSRDSFIGLWDDCINRIISKFCSAEMVIVRKTGTISYIDDHVDLQDQWPNVTGFVRNLCLWRGEETDQLREGQIEPSSSVVEKLLWTYDDLPYILGYYAIGYLVTFCALSRSNDRIIRTDLQTLDLSSPSDRLKALVPCYRIAGLLPLLADRCFNGTTTSSSSTNLKMQVYSDFERFDSNGLVTEMTPSTVTRFYSSRRKWTAVKEIYDFLDHRIPHAEFILRSSENDMSLVFKPRGIVTKSSKPINCDQLVEALKYVTKALVALHDLSFMHRDLSWDKVVRRVNERGESEWFVSGFEEAVGAPQIYPHYASGRGGYPQAPEMERGLHGVKVDVWGVGNLVRAWFGGPGVSVSVSVAVAASAAKMLRELQNRCLEQNPEARPSAADCYHHLIQLQSTHQLH